VTSELIINNFLFSFIILTGCGVHPASYPEGTIVLSSVVKWLEHDANYSPQSTAEVKNVWSYTSTPPIPMHGMVLI
jgi:hypothetical protein